MMQFLKPTRDNLNASLSIGIPLIALSFIDFFSNTFLNSNITSFLPDTLSYFFPLIIGTLGLYFVRIEFSGIRLLDNFNKNVKLSDNGKIKSLWSGTILFTTLEKGKIYNKPAIELSKNELEEEIIYQFIKCNELQNIIKKIIILN